MTNATGVMTNATANEHKWHSRRPQMRHPRAKSDTPDGHKCHSFWSVAKRRFATESKTVEQHETGAQMTHPTATNDTPDGHK